MYYTAFAGTPTNGIFYAVRRRMSNNFQNQPHRQTTAIKNIKQRFQTENVLLDLPQYECVCVCI